MKKWIFALGGLALSLLALTGAWGYEQHTVNRQLEHYLSNKYQRAFYDLAFQTQSLEVLLSKSMVSADSQLHSELLMDIRQQAAFAQSNLAQLPLDDALAGRTSKFLSQVGDFAGSLARQIGQGGKMEAEHWDTLNSLYRQVATLNSELQVVQSHVAHDSFYFGEMVRQVKSALQKAPDDAATTDFQSLDKQMQLYPALIYDGPFSEHLERSEALNVSDLEEIDAAEAERKGLFFLDQEDNTDYQIKISESSNSRIPAYRVEMTEGKSRRNTMVTMDLSRQGGKLIWMLHSRPVATTTLSIEQARQEALLFLAEHDFGIMRSTYFQQYGNTVTFNFAAMQDGVTLYSDLIKVTVALDDGQIYGIESSGYLMSHRKRDLPKALLSLKEAQKKLNPFLEVTGGELVLIPAGADEEILTYEFQGRLGQDAYLIYVNATNGREENILKLMETPGGTLTM